MIMQIILFESLSGSFKISWKYKNQKQIYKIVKKIIQTKNIWIKLMRSELEDLWFLFDDWMLHDTVFNIKSQNASKTELKH